MHPTTDLTPLTTEPAHGVDPLRFMKFTRPKYRAEYAVEGDDLVFHFFLPEGADPNAQHKFWSHEFPTQLELTAIKHFQVTAPRLQAQFIPDYGLNSWWLRAFGFGASTLSDALAQELFIELDQALATMKDK